MEDLQQPRRVTIRLTPFQARALGKLRHSGRLEGQEPRTVTAVLVEAILRWASEVSEVDQKAVRTPTAVTDVRAQEEI